MLSHTRHLLDRVPPPIRSVLQSAMDRFQLGDLSIHGPAHWLKVFFNATMLAQSTPGADLIVVELFAILHDCERQNESFDPGHGPRAAAYARELHTAGRLEISSQQLATLCDAVARHADGLVSDDPTIGVCWDADRLDLPRVGMSVDARFLSTSAAKQLAS